MSAWLTTVINTPLGEVKIETVDFTKPGYECNGFECVTTDHTGESWGMGPENDDETPLDLHLSAVLHAAALMGSA